MSEEQKRLIEETVENLKHLDKESLLVDSLREECLIQAESDKQAKDKIQERTDRIALDPEH